MARKHKQAIIEPPQSAPYRWWILGVFGSFFVMMLYPLFNQFIPSHDWYSFSFKLNIAISLLLSAWYFYILNINQTRLASINRRYNKWLVYFFTPVIVYLMAYMAIIYGVGDLATRVSNKPHTILDVVEKLYVESRKGCNTRLVSSTLKEAMPPNICISQQDFDRFPQRVAIKIKGQRSYFGFHINKIEYDWATTSTLTQPERPTL
jgi:hypothetical protein